MIQIRQLVNLLVAATIAVTFVPAPGYGQNAPAGAPPPTAFSPDGRLVATPAANGDVNLWDAASGVLLAALTGHSDAERQLQVAQARALLAKARTMDRLMELALRGDVDADLALDALSDVTALAFSRNGRMLAAGDFEGHVRVWDVESRVLRTEFQSGEAVTTAERRNRSVRNRFERSQPVRFLGFSPTDKTLVVATGAPKLTLGVSIRDLAAAAMTRSFTDVRAFDVSHDGRVLAFAVDQKKEIALWDIETAAPLRVIVEEQATRPTHPIYWVALSPTGTVLAVGVDGLARSDDGAVVVRDAQSGDLLWRQDPLPTPVPSRPSARFSPNGETILMYFNTPERSEGYIGTVSTGPKQPTLKTARTGTLIAKLTVFEGSMSGVVTSMEPFVLSPDGRFMATMIADETKTSRLSDSKKNAELRVWDAFTGTLKTTLKQEDPVAFAPNGERLLTWTRNGALRLWDLERMRQLWTVSDYSGTTKNR